MRFVICELMFMEHELRTFRKAHSLTLDALADATGLSKSYLSEIETRKRPAGRKAIQVICERTGLSPAAFFPSPVGSPSAIGAASPSVAVSPDGTEGAFLQQG